MAKFKLASKLRKTVTFATGMMPSIRMIDPLSNMDLALLSQRDETNGYPAAVISKSNAQRKIEAVLTKTANGGLALSYGTAFFSKEQNVVPGWEDPALLLERFEFMYSRQGPTRYFGPDVGEPFFELDGGPIVYQWGRAELTTYDKAETTDEQRILMRENMRLRLEGKVIELFNRTFPGFNILTAFTAIGNNPNMPSYQVVKAGAEAMRAAVNGIVGDVLYMSLAVPVGQAGMNGLSVGWTCLQISVNKNRVPGLLKFDAVKPNIPARPATPPGSQGPFDPFDLPSYWNFSQPPEIVLDQNIRDLFTLRQLSPPYQATVQPDSGAFTTTRGFALNAPAWVRSVFLGEVIAETATSYTVAGDQLTFVMEGETFRQITQLPDRDAAPLAGIDLYYHVYATPRKFLTDPVQQTTAYEKQDSDGKAELLAQEMFPADVEEGTPAVSVGQASTTASGATYKDVLFFVASAASSDDALVVANMNNGSVTYVGGDEVDWLGAYMLDRKWDFVLQNGTGSASALAAAIAGKEVTRGSLTKDDPEAMSDAAMGKESAFTEEVLGKNRFAWIGIQQFGASREQSKAAVRASIAQAIIQNQTLDYT